MANGISIPGVSDKYKTNDLVEALMAVERKPLNREKDVLEKYQSQQNAWRGVNQKMSSLRESVKTLYSFENPFNNKITSSTQEDCITAEAGRDADFTSFQVEVINPAASDKFLSKNIEKNFSVPAGIYSYTVGEKSIHFNWKGGKLTDWVNALNKRSNQLIKASIIGVSKDQQALVIESLKTGNENKIVFEKDALEFAKNIEMIKEIQSEAVVFPSSETDLKATETKDSFPQKNLPDIEKDSVKFDRKKYILPPRSGFELTIPEKAKQFDSTKIEFTLNEKNTEDICEAINNKATGPVLSEPGSIYYKGISISNFQTETTLDDFSEEDFVPLTSISDNKLVFIKDSSGKETLLDYTQFTKASDSDERKISFLLKDYPDAQEIVFRNSNTGRQYEISEVKAFDEQQYLGYAPVHAITTASDAKIKYEGITLTRPTNNIDDVIPHLTLHLHDKTDKNATIKISPDTESAKDALITFVGKYNQTIAEINILSSNKPEIISELDYLTPDEVEQANSKLGMFFGDTTLTNGRTSLQQIISANYSFSEDDSVTMLGQIGISTNASSGSRSYNAAQMRGYLEIDEKKLDAALENNLSDIKKIFGYDSDGDLIIDEGIGYKLDRQLTAWVQSNGILSVKTSALERNIKSSNEKIAKLEDQLEKKESELKRKYASMEGTLNSLESQSNTISNFSKQNNGNNQ